MNLWPDNKIDTALAAPLLPCKAAFLSGTKKCAKDWSPTEIFSSIPLDLKFDFKTPFFCVLRYATFEQLAKTLKLPRKSNTKFEHEL